MDKDLNNNNFIEKNICNRCIFILKNIVKINSRTDIGETEETKKLANENSEQEKNTKNDLNISLQNIENYSDSDRFLCKFCIGILNEKKYNSLISMITEKIQEYTSEHFNFKLTTNFTALFLMIHTYVK